MFSGTPTASLKPFFVGNSLDFLAPQHACDGSVEVKPAHVTIERPADDGRTHSLAHERDAERQSDSILLLTRT
eukprot:6029491-Pleurochrysis_carterae.AAC.1